AHAVYREPTSTLVTLILLASYVMANCIPRVLMPESSATLMLAVYVAVVLTLTGPLGPSKLSAPLDGGGVFVAVGVAVGVSVERTAVPLGEGETVGETDGDGLACAPTPIWPLCTVTP